MQSSSDFLLKLISESGNALPGMQPWALSSNFCAPIGLKPSSSEPAYSALS